MLSFRKNKIIKEEISQFFKIVIETLVSFQETAIHHLDNGCDTEYKKLMKMVIHKESEADDLRRKIETELYRKSLLPEFREDILQSIDKLDELPDKAEDIVKMIYNQNISVPLEFRESIKELIKLGTETVILLIKSAKSAIGNTKEVKELRKQIDINESRGDIIEGKIIFDIFHKEVVNIQSIMLKSYIVKIGSILDITQDVADTMTLIAIKRVI